MTQPQRVMFRQGDVLVVFVPHNKGIPERAIEVKSNERRVVLAHGEVTGHAHAIELLTDDEGKPNVKYFDFGAERFIQALVDVTLRHEEHGAIILKQGVYRQAFQVEDYGVERRAVAD